MKVNQLFDNISDITMEAYLKKHGIDNVDKYLTPNKDCIEDVEHYDNMEEAWDVIYFYLRRNLDLYVIQDSDVDGLCSASIIYQYLKMLKPDVHINVLFQKDKRHGIHKDNVNEITNDSLLIVPDASIENIEIAKMLEENNIQCVVLDHHPQSVKNGNITTVNCQLSENVKNKSLSGAGVTHKFCQYIDGQIGKKFSNQFVDLVALSIISDSMSLLSYENRAYLKVGLNNINNPFYKYLCKNLIKSETITPKDLSFNVINIINAVQRSANQQLKQDLFDCFVGNKKENEYEDVLKACKKEKRTQDDAVKEIVETADVIESKSLVIAQTDGENGYSGLISNKLMSKYRKPVFVVHMDENGQMKGSCRSPVPIRTTLNASDKFVYVAGHENAFGVCYYPSKEDDIVKFCDNINLEDCANYDVIVSVNVNEAQKIPFEIFNWHEKYGQMYGTELPEPLIHIKNIRTNGKYIYEMGNGSTIKLLLGDLTAIKFFCSKDYRQSIHVGENVPLNIELIGTLQINHYNGIDTKQIVIEYIDVQLAEQKEMTIDDLW